MVNKEDCAIAIGSAIGTAVFVFIFGITVFVPSLDMFAYASSMGIAICYMVLTVANEQFASSRTYARLSVAFAVVYCTMVCIVYYTQLTFVRLGRPSPEAISLVGYEHTGSAFFAIDILGYFFMSLSVICLGLTLRDNIILQRLFVAMGIWGGTCIGVPLVPFFYNTTDTSSSNRVGVVALSLWAVLFYPLMVMLAKHFYRQWETSKKKCDASNKME